MVKPVVHSATIHSVQANGRRIFLSTQHSVSHQVGEMWSVSGVGEDAATATAAAAAFLVFLFLLSECRRRWEGLKKQLQGLSLTDEVTPQYDTKAQSEGP